MKNKIIEAIKAYDTVIIHRHVRPDPDAYGSQGGLKELIKASFPEKNVFIVGEEDAALDYLQKMDEVSSETYEGALVIICDTANLPRVSDQRYHLGDQLIKIDHHPDETPYGDLSWVDTNASSTSEMIYELYLEGKKAGLKLSDTGAKLIYAGIVGDTGRFLFPNTRAKTFAYAKELVEYNFNRVELYNNMYKTSERIARLSGYILQNFELSENGMCAIEISKELMEEYNVTSEETSQLVHVVSNISGLKAWIFFIEEADLIRVRIRSKGPVINRLASEFNGGGHPLASGASVTTWAEANELKKRLDELCRNDSNS